MNPVRFVRPAVSPALLILLSILLAGCDDTATAPANYAPFTQADLRVGSGAEATSGTQLSVHYTGWLFDEDAPAQKGPQFDSSAGRGPLIFVLGQGQVIAGWDVGLPGMKVGGLRRLIIPPSLGYGNARNQSIPPNSTLLFEIELLAVE